MFWLPAGAPAAVAARLNEQANLTLRDPGLAARATQAGFLLTGGTEAQARDFVAAENVKWGRVIRERRILFEG